MKDGRIATFHSCTCQPTIGRPAMVTAVGEKRVKHISDYFYKEE
jgi:hypothetical protein